VTPALPAPKRKTWPRARRDDHDRRLPRSLAQRRFAVQAASISVDVDHDHRPIGAVKYLELTESRRRYAVCEIDGSGLDEGPWFYGPKIRRRDRRDIELLELSVTRNPASVGIEALTAFPPALERAIGRIVYRDGFAGGLVEGAYEYDRSRSATSRSSSPTASATASVNGSSSAAT
jgi:hypothetical protein